jgi:hypothetical protein
MLLPNVRTSERRQINNVRSSVQVPGSKNGTSSSFKANEELTITAFHALKNHKNSTSKDTKMSCAINAELVTSSATTQVQEPHVLVKAFRVSPSSKRSRSNKRACKKQSQHINVVSCPTVLSFFVFIAVITSLILFSRLDCFSMHFGLPKTISGAQVHHTAADGSFVELSGSMQISLDAASMAQLETASKLGIELPMEIKAGSSAVPTLAIGADQVKEALMSQQRRMPIPTAVMSS